MPKAHAVVLAVALLASCREAVTLSEADCAAVGMRLQRAWNTDAVAAMRSAETDAPRAFIGDEERSVGSGWAQSCRRLVGKPVDPAEVDCLRRADTIDDVYECAR